MNILGIETSCDESSLAIVADGRNIISHEISSQVDIHAPYSGVVPELASRAHVEALLPLYRKITRDKLTFDAVAATQGPGLSGSLMTGMSFAKALSYALELPFYAVDHIKAHAYAIQLEQLLDKAFLVLIASGGHTILAVSRSPLDLEVAFSTIDDACGEAFDKVADFLGLGYPGGPCIEAVAKEGNPQAYAFPSPFRSRTMPALSYSGLKTAVTLQSTQFLCEGAKESAANIAASFQHVACEALVNAACYAASRLSLDTIVVCGGVAANTYFRTLFAEEKPSHMEVLFPSPILCTDNAAMIAGLAYWHKDKELHASYDAPVYSREPRYRGMLWN